MSEELFDVWDVVVDEVRQVPRMEAAAGMLRFARTQDGPARAVWEKRALDLARGDAVEMHPATRNPFRASEFACPECRRIVSGAHGHASECVSRTGLTAPHPDEYAAAAERAVDEAKWHPEREDYGSGRIARDAGTWESCGCLRNEAGAHRVGCPDHPEGIPGR